MESRSAATLVTLAALVSFCAGRWSVSVVFKPTPLTDVASDVASDLYSPPAGHGLVRVPSTVTDRRGEVHNLELGNFRFNVLESKAGALRSGDVHRREQRDMIFSGCARRHSDPAPCRVRLPALAQARAPHNARGRTRRRARVQIGRVGGYSTPRAAPLPFPQPHGDGRVVEPAWSVRGEVLRAIPQRRRPRRWSHGAGRARGDETARCSAARREGAS